MIATSGRCCSSRTPNRIRRGARLAADTAAATGYSLRHYAERQAIIGVYTRMMVGTGAGKVDAETAVSERNLSRQPTLPKFVFVRAS